MKRTAQALGIATLLAGLLSGGCSDPVEPEAEELIVVEAYLRVGEPVEEVRLYRVVPLGEDPSLAATVDDATVTLHRGSSRWVLTAHGEGRYGYDGTDLTVGADEEWSLSVARGGEVFAEATTRTPSRPTGVRISADTLWLQEAGTPFGGGFSFDADAIELEWDNDPADWHYVVYEGLDPEADFILPDIFRERFGDFEIVTEPTLNGFSRLRTLQLERLGDHAAVVYRVNREYADLFENQTQDSRDLNEPPSNVRGALGVFSAFNGVRIPFTVVREGG